MRIQHKTTKPAEGLTYRQPPEGDAFWCPDYVKEVANHLGWCVLYVEQHPDGSVIVTFGDGSGFQGPGRIFEMHLDVVRGMHRNTCNKRSRIASPWDLL